MTRSNTKYLHLVEQAKSIFDAAVKAVSASSILESVSELPGSGTYHVVGAGKAAMSMAAALEQKFPDCTFQGEVVVPYGYISSFPKGQPAPKMIKVIEAGHPVPDKCSQSAAKNALEIAHSCDGGDTLIVLLSGGASALWSLPATGLTLQDLQTVNQLLLRSGAPIHHINAVRKHLSAIKGGKLATTAWPAQTITLAISDVVGDDRSVIGSGPTVADPTTWWNAMQIIDTYDIQAPEAVLEHLELGIGESIVDTPKPDSIYLERSDFHMLGSNLDAVSAAERTAQNMGYEVVEINYGVTDEARDFGGMIARHLLKLQSGQCILWGGEPIVTVQGNGKGGRNQELALAAACEFRKSSVNAVLLSGGTDGIDGPTDAAGGWAVPGTVERAKSLGVDPYAALEANDAYHCLKAIDQLFITGPTHTNVMDIGIGLIGP